MLIGGIHDNVRLIPTFIWLWPASFDCSWYLSWSMNMCHYSYRKFSESTSLLHRSYVLTCGSDMAATRWAFRAKLWRSTWLTPPSFPFTVLLICIIVAQLSELQWLDQRFHSCSTFDSWGARVYLEFHWLQVEPKTHFNCLIASVFFFLFNNFFFSFSSIHEPS